MSPWIRMGDGRYIVRVTSTELYYLLDGGEWGRYIDSEARLGFVRGFFDGDGMGLIPAYANINIELLEYIRQILA